MRRSIKKYVKKGHGLERQKSKECANFGDKKKKSPVSLVRRIIYRAAADLCRFVGNKKNGTEEKEEEDVIESDLVPKGPTAKKKRGRKKKKGGLVLFWVHTCAPPTILSAAPLGVGVSPISSSSSSCFQVQQTQNATS